MNGPAMFSAVEAQRTEGLPLAALVGSRLCHDLISPLGAIGNGLELLQMAGDWPGLAKSPEFQLIAESVQAARARISVFRVAFGHAAAGQRMGVPELRTLALAHAGGSRLAVTVDGEGDLPRAEARMILLALMCMDSALPWGGRVLICRGARGWRLLGEAARTRIDLPLWGWLDGAGARVRPSPAPAEVHFALLAGLSDDLHRPLQWELDETGAEIAF